MDGMRVIRKLYEQIKNAYRRRPNVGGSAKRQHHAQECASVPISGLYYVHAVSSRFELRPCSLQSSTTYVEYAKNSPRLVTCPRKPSSRPVHCGSNKDKHWCGGTN
ncbi:hypothetical protein DPMN_116377 [Dreissena polymorpha]|uniref:Uncharacterized protein n=1 Tax=Dreissena polymorpha TaxID=45954 RepID=A0A9D4KN04_DREPO|nr:hypothetical protein DPMN_116377 [Dreissena polymorpha]